MTVALPRWAAALCLSAVALAATADAALAADSVDLIVRRDAGLTAAERADVRADAGVEHDRNLRLPDTEVVSVPADRADAALDELRADPDVRWAQRDAGVTAQAVRAADSYWGSLWGLENTGQMINGLAGSGDADMDGPEAWMLSTGAGVTVAVADTGVDPNHEDLAGQLATNAGEIGAGRESNHVDDDGDGLVDNWRGWDFTYDDNNPNDIDAHGSHVAGTIAAVNGNGKGISGLAPDAKILALKVLDDTGHGSWSDLADAFDYAGDRGIRVVNASLGAEAYVPAIDDTVAMHPNTLYVVSAGNDNADMDATTYYPCESTANNVLCVGASDNRDTKAAFSNYSPTGVDVFAPGVSVLSSYVGNACGSSLYCFYNGTSMASPHVAAEAALLVARDPTLTAAELKQTIIDSAEPKAALASYGRNGGRANARAALELVFPPADNDSDGIADELDNCPAAPNAGQADADGDGTGDACDAHPDHDDRDNDSDGVANVDDNCPAAVNPGQADADRDGTGDACDATPRGGDGDWDGLAALDDNCPNRWNAGQADSDHDGIGDACDDSDNDGIVDAYDNCPFTANTAQADIDFDGTGDACDTAPPTDDGGGDVPPPAPVVVIPPTDTDAPLDVEDTPTVTAAKATANRARCGKRACARTITVRFTATNATSATVTLERQKCPRANCAYTSATSRKAVAANGNFTLELKTRMAAGRYRVTVVVTGPGGSAKRTLIGSVR